MQHYSNKHSNSQSKKKSKRASRNRGETHPNTSNNTVTSHVHPVSPYISPTHIQKQDRQCTYNVTLRRVRATTDAVEKQKYDASWVCVCCLRRPACNAHTPSCHTWPARLYNIFSHYLINGTIFGGGKKLLNIKMCFLIFSTTFVWNISHPKKKWARYNHKCT